MRRIALPNFPNLELEFDPENQREFGPCPHCGEMTSRVWGYIYRSEEAAAAYFVEWTPRHAERDATFDLIVGKWGEQTQASNRQAVSVAFKRLHSGPSFMVQDARARKVAGNPLVASALDRDAVIGTPLAEEIFTICDLVYFADPRLDDLRY
jgi:hypothetical protein